MKIVKIVLGIIFLFGGISNIPGAFTMPTPRQAAWYLVPTIFFLILGVWLLYSGIVHGRTQPKIFDASDIGDDEA